MKQINSHRTRILATAVVAAIGAMTALAPASFGQNRVGGDGRLMEANNRVGSGGFNDSSSSSLPPGLFNNLLVTGNVTGGVAFQGKVPYFAPGAFNGTLPGSFVDNFVSGSTNVQTNGVMVDNAQNVHLFVGDNRGVNPPAGFVSTGAQPGYIPAAAPSGTQFTYDSRLGSPAVTPISGIVPSAIFQTGGTQAGGPQSAYVTASPLFGVKSLQTAQQVGGTGAFSNTLGAGASVNNVLGTGDRVNLSQDTINSDLAGGDNSLGSSLSGSAVGASGLGTPAGVSSFSVPRASANGQSTNAAGQQGTGAQFSRGSANGNNASGNNATGNGNANLQQQANGSVQNPPIDASVNSQGTSAALSASPLGASISGTPMSGALNTGEDSATNIYSPTSNQPGSAYMRMIQRLKGTNPNAPLTPVERNLLNQAKLQDIKASQSTNQPKSGTIRQSSPAGKPAGAGTSFNGGGTDLPPGGAAQPQSLQSGPLIPQQVTPGTDNKPILLKSFSQDESSPQTKELLTKAEDLMKQGKFTSAIEEYDLVEQQAPAQPFIELARANAELGASYYGLSEAHLRQAFLSDQALLSAQLDLKGLLGEDKLQYLVKDLKQIAQANPTESRPVFLLAYICYNTNNPRGAAAYLDLAEKREGKADPFFKLLRSPGHWDLPEIGDQNSTDELNK